MRPVAVIKEAVEALFKTPVTLSAIIVLTVNLKLAGNQEGL
jgi:hypothetical protein